MCNKRRRCGGCVMRGGGVGGNVMRGGGVEGVEGV